MNDAELKTGNPLIGDRVRMRFGGHCTQEGSRYGIPPTGQRMGVNAVSTMNFAGGQWKGSWNFAHKLGLLLQLGWPDLILG